MAENPDKRSERDRETKGGRKRERERGRKREREREGERGRERAIRCTHADTAEFVYTSWTW